MRLPFLLLFPCLLLNTPAETAIKQGHYHGWSNAFFLSNGKIEVVVVPAVGRIMQMRFVGEEEGPFWEDRQLDGKRPDPEAKEWGNFGGDKTWPAPQSDWPKVTGRSWPPPQAFDSLPVTIETRGQTLVMISPLDRHYGIQTERHISLDPERAEMNVKTRYLKREGTSARVSIWIITQLREPERLFMPLPAQSLFPLGYNKQSADLPAGLKFENGMVSCERSPRSSTKIGSDASRLIWADATHVLEVFSAREPGGEFPDNNSSAEIYTNPDPKKYIELELLGPLQTLKAGETMERNQRYRLFRRNGEDLWSQVRRLGN